MHSDDSHDSKSTSRLTIAIDTLGCGFSQFCVACLSAVLSMFAFLLPELKIFWDCSTFTESFICSVTFLGLFCGNIIWGVVADKYGRKLVITYCTLTCIFFTITASLSVQSYLTLFIISEFGTGIGLGGGVVALTYFIEFLPRVNRGFWLIVIEITWTLGSVYGSVLAYLLLKKNFIVDYKISFFVLLSALPSILIFFMLPFLPESIRYDMVNVNEKRIEETIRWMEKVNCRQLGPDHINRIFTLSNDENESQSVPDEIKKPRTHEKPKENSLSVFDIFRNDPNMIYMFLSICVFSISGSICYFGFSLSSPLFFSEQNRFLGGIVLALSELPGILFGIFATYYFSRKASQGVSFLVAGISLFFMLIPDHGDEREILHFFFGFLGRSSVMAASSVTWILAQESLPTQYRTSLVGLSASFGKIGVILAPFLVEMMPGGNAMVPKIVFGSLALFAAFVCYFYPVDTKGKELDFGMDKISSSEKGV